jgi:hypothetical protein
MWSRKINLAFRIALVFGIVTFVAVNESLAQTFELLNFKAYVNDQLSGDQGDDIDYDIEDDLEVDMTVKITNNTQNVWEGRVVYRLVQMLPNGQQGYSMTIIDNPIVLNPGQSKQSTGAVAKGDAGEIKWIGGYDIQEKVGNEYINRKSESCTFHIDVPQGGGGPG